MNVAPVQNNNFIKKVLTNPKAASFAQNTVCAIAVETTLKALGRPTFIYYDKHANKQSKKYAATKELIYQVFCLGLFLSFINPVKNRVYKFMENKATASSSAPETNKRHIDNKRKLDLFDAAQDEITKAKDKTARKAAEEKLVNLLHKNKDYHFGKGVRELSSIVSTVFILALCAPILSQIILHPVMDLLFKKDDKKSASDKVNKAQKSAAVTTDNTAKADKK